MRSKVRFVIAAVIVMQLGGCSWVPDAVNPISWYRGVTGASKNDDLGKGQNQQNLNEGSNEPYPNLGNVPNPPDTAMSTVDRAKLADSLIADRKDAEYADDNLHAGANLATTPAPPPPPPAPAKPEAKSEAKPGSPAAPSKATTAASTLPAKPTPSAATPGAAKEAAAVPGRGSESPPAESPLKSPTVKDLPKGEAPMPAPPPPRLPPAAQPSKAPMKEAAAPAIMPPPPPPKLPAEDVKARPVPAEAASHRIAVIGFAPGSALLADKEKAEIAKIVKLHKERGGTVRIVGHGEGRGANAAVTGFNLALDRAQAVAVALSEAGIASKDISVDAAPVAARGGQDVPRAEVFLSR